MSLQTEQRAAGEGAADAESDGSGDEELSTDELFHILSNRRRRYVLHYLFQRDEPVELRELSAQLTAWENDVELQGVTHKMRRSVYNSLQQTHLPRMAKSGIISFDDRSGTVELTSRAVDFDIYVDIVPGREIPWSVYYLILGAFWLSVLLATQLLPVAPFTTFDQVTWSLFMAVSFTVSGAVHVYVSRKRRLGSSGKPPELRVEE
ncbi:hypothetical protein SAMN04487949_0475 [Halogranum gelatinilyticum]|uniref:DUF7344 domain-containing protein n=1 Tax=Halogranum gelatinilyticum TaxID=660521 RepID=A0A1G9PQ25_9EURY|nr:hypothetical protein [Halogranum gelatinilyticum]SDM00789.1 hypothetical protein SAMN04487949_0475 [Halogranum gelatinilyticum]